MVFSPSLAEFLLFQPSRGDPGEPPPLSGIRGTAITLSTSDGVRIQAWWYESKGKAPSAEGAELDSNVSPLRPAPAVLFLHGNAGDISNRTPLAEGLLREGLSVLLLEYRGYGGSEGRPSEEGLHLDALAGHAFLVEQVGDPDRIVVFGRSMGGAVAAHLAAELPSAGLVLEASFTSLEGMGRIVYPILPGFFFHRLRGCFSTLDWVRQVEVPLLVIHGTDDEIVPMHFGQELLAAGREPKDWFSVEGAGHNDVYWVGGASYFRRIGGFVGECAEGGPLNEEPAP